MKTVIISNNDIRLEMTQNNIYQTNEVELTLTIHDIDHKMYSQTVILPRESLGKTSVLDGILNETMVMYKRLIKKRFLSLIEK